MINHEECLPAGYEIAGFKLIEAISQGKQGIIYKATQINLNRSVTLKILYKHLASDKEFIKALSVELRNATANPHPNVIQTYDTGCSEEGLLYHAMEYISGGSVEEYLSANGKFPIEEALKYMIEVATVLENGAQRQMIHGGIKPANLMMSDNGSAKLTDLGLIRLENKGTPGLTPLYAAPELIKGVWKKGDYRADMYAMGATLYEMLSGKAPFFHEDYQVVMKMQLEKTAVPLIKKVKNITPGISKLVDQLLSKKASDRFESWSQVKIALRSVLENYTKKKPSRSSAAKATSGPSGLKRMKSAAAKKSKNSGKKTRNQSPELRKVKEKLKSNALKRRTLKKIG